MKNPPFRSPRSKVGELYHFGRMLDKIRLNLRNELPEEYRPNLGNRHGLDGHCCGFFGVEFGDLVERVKQGGTDEEILEWCFAKGLRPNPIQIAVWNSFAEKYGWRDRAAAFVAKVKKEDAHEHLTDLMTAFDMIDFREGRLHSP
jgi:hypothetical protein